MKKVIHVVFVLFVFGCGVETKPNPNFDAGHDSGGTGGSGGAGGSGGDASFDSGLDAPTDAAADSDAEVDSGDAALPLPCDGACDGSTPYCDVASMECVACLETIHCGDDVCDTATHTCVNCTASEGCGADAVCNVANRSCVECVGTLGCMLPEVCDDASNTCVACNMDVDCGSASLVCLEGGHTCVECNDVNDCDNNELCKPSTNTCEQCLADSDCTNPTAAKCNQATNTCVPCDDNTQCTGVTDGATTLGVCSAGVCSQCTETDTSACGNGTSGQPRVCNVTTKRCGTAAQTTGSAGLCQTCVGSAQCQTGQACVPQTFEGHEVGNFCFWRIAATEGPNGSCLSVPPYARGLANETSLEGRSVNICGLRNTTCPGINHFSNPSVACAPGGTPDDDLCGFSYANEGEPSNDRDAYCEQVPNDTAYRCTVPCGSDDDCVGGFACQVGATPRVCGL